MKQKRGMSKTAWILLVVAIILLAIGIYFWLSSDSASILSGRNSVPQPPALPSE